MTKLPKKESVKVEFKTTFNEEAIETLVAFSKIKLLMGYRNHCYCNRGCDNMNRYA